MSTEPKRPSEAFYLTIFLLPMVLFLLLTSVEAYAGKEVSLGLFAVLMPDYPVLYTLKVLLLTPVVLVCFRYWVRAFPLHFTRKTLLAVLVGAVGIVVWVGVCKLGLEDKFWQATGLAKEPAQTEVNTQVGLDVPPPSIVYDPHLDGEIKTASHRSGFNPFAYWGGGKPAWSFFVIRMLGLACLVPLLEEFFLRGFLLRFLWDQEKWPTLGVGVFSLTIVAASALYGVVTHPDEAVAAMLWFPMITALVAYTKNIWDAVVAHAVTNFLLGMYVLHTGAWFFM